MDTLNAILARPTQWRGLGAGFAEASRLFLIRRLANIAQRAQVSVARIIECGYFELISIWVWASYYDNTKLGFVNPAEKPAYSWSYMTSSAAIYNTCQWSIPESLRRYAFKEENLDTRLAISCARSVCSIIQISKSRVQGESRCKCAEEVIMSSSPRRLWQPGRSQYFFQKQERSTLL